MGLFDFNKSEEKAVRKAPARSGAGAMQTKLDKLQAGHDQLTHHIEQRKQNSRKRARRNLESVATAWLNASVCFCIQEWRIGLRQDREMAQALGTMRRCFGRLLLKDLATRIGGWARATREDREKIWGFTCSRLENAWLNASVCFCIQEWRIGLRQDREMAQALGTMRRCFGRLLLKDLATRIGGWARATREDREKMWGFTCSRLENEREAWRERCMHVIIRGCLRSNSKDIDKDIQQRWSEWVRNSKNDIHASREHHWKHALCE